MKEMVWLERQLESQTLLQHGRLRRDDMDAGL